MKFKFKFIAFEKTKFKFIDFDKTVFKFIFEFMKNSWADLSLEFKLKFSALQKLQLQFYLLWKHQCKI